MSDPQKATELKNLGNEAFKNKNYEQAIDYFTQAIACNPNDHVFYSNRSNSYVNIKQYDKALEDADQCIKINPAWPRGYQRKGTALFYLEKYEEASDAYKEGLKQDPVNQPLKNGLKAVEDKIGQQPQMNEAYLQAMMKLIGNPQTKDYIQDPALMQKLQAAVQNPAMQAYFSTDDPRVKKAMDVIRGSPDPNFDDFMKQMPKFSKAEPPKQQEPPKSAPKKEEPPKKEQKMEPEDPAQNIKNRGNAEFKKKNFKEAIELYEEAIQLKPEEPLYYNNKAAAFIELNDFENALIEVNKAQNLIEDGTVKDYVRKAKVFARKASLLNKQEKYGEAIKYYEKSLVEDGVQKVRDELKVAKKLLKEQEAKDYLNPELAEKACEYGNTLFKEGKYPQALKEYEESIKRNPDVAKYYSNIGMVYIKLMEWNSAKNNFEICLKKDPTYIKAYGKKGDCHYSMKEYHKALETYEAGLKLDPNNEVCKQGLQKTQQQIYLSNSKQSPEEQQQRAQRAMADPEIQSILNTPEVRNALNDLQSDPKSIQNIMKNPSLAQKIDKLIQAGVIGMG